MEYAFLLFAFVCGLTVKLIGIPPLVGYLVAGFLLNFAGYTLTEDLTQIANLGNTIMLFTIGLKAMPLGQGLVSLLGGCCL